jgi:hypothetical protein
MEILLVVMARGETIQPLSSGLLQLRSRNDGERVV